MTENNRCQGKGEPSTGTHTRETWFDAIFAALSDARRRYVLYYLRNEAQASVTDITRQIIAWEHGVPAEDVPDEVGAEIETLLVHSHLPQLRNARLVDYDQRSEQLVRRDLPELVESCLEHCAAHELPT
ncbi:DUF7344 domain-containing protein [Natronococcus occultus]|uniref:DUF7344 domain-containing protein n=1 Tax=Natronococcus occultus SP4 TaxID=694430 RepID=L0K3Y0_9EURY|nr:transcriptional regulator [Natronococcus occultus]AGB38788.1 hypothetical protein Natoc_3043 [Natronococcus occultus SP4]